MGWFVGGDGRGESEAKGECKERQHQNDDQSEIGLDMNIIYC